MASCAGAAEVTGSRKRKLGEVGDGLTQAEDVEQPELGKVSTPLLGGRGPEVEDTSDGAFGERGAPVSAMDAEDGDPQELIADDEDAEREADEPASEESEGAAPAPGPDDPDEPRIQMFAPRPSGPVGAGAQQAAGHERAGTQRRAPPVGDPRPGPVSTLTRLTQAGVLALGETLRYESNGKGEVISGVLRQKGVECHHCARTVSVSGFATCAAQVLGIGPGRPQGRAVLRHIFTRDGRSLEQCVQQMEAANGDAAAASGALVEECFSPAAEPAPEGSFSDELCRICGEGSSLLACETCPATFHLACIGLNASKIPQGPWHCPACRCSDCGKSDFVRDGFAARTMLLCDQCEREFHVECLRKRGHVLTGVPEGAWFCSDGCGRVYRELRAALQAGPIPVGGGYSWQILRGGSSPPKMLKEALGVVGQCFHPIIDAHTKQDLVPLIVCSGRTDFSDFSGFFSMCLRFDESFVTVATVRLLGSSLAEMPLVGTSHKYRKQGFARRLVRLIEEALATMNVTRLVLPAVPDVEGTWIRAFGFRHCTHKEKLECSSKGILMFPGTALLIKDLEPMFFTQVPQGPPPEPATFLKGRPSGGKMKGLPGMPHVPSRQFYDPDSVVVGTTRSHRQVRAQKHYVDAVRELVSSRAGRRGSAHSAHSHRTRTATGVHNGPSNPFHHAYREVSAHRQRVPNFYGEAAFVADPLGPLPQRERRVPAGAADTLQLSPATPDMAVEGGLYAPGGLVAGGAPLLLLGPPGDPDARARAARARGFAKEKRRLMNSKVILAARALESARIALAALDQCNPPEDVTDDEDEEEREDMRIRAESAFRAKAHALFSAASPAAVKTKASPRGQGLLSPTAAAARSAAVSPVPAARSAVASPVQAVLAPEAVA